MNSACVKPVPRLIAYRMKTKYGSQVSTMPLTAGLSSGARYSTSSRPQASAPQMNAMRFVDFHRIFWCRLMNSSLRYSNPFFRLVIEVSAEIAFSLVCFESCLTESIWFSI